MTRKSGLAHCCHHDRHWECCYDFDERVKYIKEHKPANEQELRLRLFKLVPEMALPGHGSLEWAAYGKACAAYGKAGFAYDKARAAAGKAWAAYEKAGAAYDKAGVAYDKAGAAYEKACAAYGKARAAYGKAGAAYGKACAAYLAKHQSELDELHDKMFPDCPWNGKTIF